MCFRVFFVPHFVIPFPNHTAYITLNATQTPMCIHRFGCAIMKKYRHENYNSSSAHLRLAASESIQTDSRGQFLHQFVMFVYSEDR